MRSRYKIHGLGVDFVSDHPMSFNMIDQDLRTFRIKSKTIPAETLKLSIVALPVQTSGNSYPAPFSKYRHVHSQFLTTPEGIVSRFGRSLITVMNHPSRRRIQVGMVPEPFLFPDPAYHYALTQPVSPWLKQRGLFFLHAACVSEKQKGILIAGHSRAGKSTLSLAAVRAGFKFLSDEQPLLSIRNGQLQVYAFPRRIRLDRSVAASFSELKSILKSSESDRIIFPIEQIWPKCLVNSCKPRLLIFPKFHRKGPMKISSLGPSETLSRILQDDHFVWYLNGPWKKVSQQHLTLLTRLAHETPAFQLDYGIKDVFKIPAVFRRLLK